MEKKRKSIQLYAIIVNVVAIIAFIISTTSLISALIDRNAPAYAGYSNVDLSSFEKYKMDVLKNTQKDDAYVPTDEMIRQMFEAANDERINKVLHQSFRTIVVSSVVIGISLILFIPHWFIIRKYEQMEAS